MKKCLKFLIKNIFLWIGAFFVGYHFNEMIIFTKENVQYIKDISQNENSQFTYEKTSDVNICEKRGFMDDCWSDVVDDQLSIINSDILSKFEKSGYDMYVTSSDIATTYCNDSEFNTVLGLTDYHTKKIYIQKKYKALHSAPIHEIGHWLDEYENYTSDSAEFKSIYENEGNFFKVNFYNIDDFSAAEMFAEGFNDYYLESEELEDNCPQLYEYIDQIVSDF